MSISWEKEEEEEQEQEALYEIPCRSEQLLQPHNNNYNYNQRRRLNRLAALVVTYPQASRGDS
jgi:hypothetical protein